MAAMAGRKLSASEEFAGILGLRSDERLFSLAAVFSDVHDFVLEDKQIRRAFAGQAHHVLVVVFDPTGDDVPIHQLDADLPLLFTQALKKPSFFEGLFRRRGSAVLAAMGSALYAESHANILHKSRRPPAS